MVCIIIYSNIYLQTNYSIFLYKIKYICFKSNTNIVYTMEYYFSNNERLKTEE